MGRQMTGRLWNKISLKPPTVPVSGEFRYLTALWVSGNEEPPDEPSLHGSFQSTSSIPYKIRAALKLLTFRDQRVLVQFWSVRDVGKHQLLTTVDQPFGLGVVNEEELCSYRKYSEHNLILVDKDQEEEDLSPPARVFRQGLPEWTSDLTNYKTKDFPQKDSAMRCDLHGYLALPVFDSTTGLCIGVLELLTSVKYTCYAFEVQQVHKALKAENLTSPQVFDFPISKVLHERRQNELIKLMGILKTVCDIHSLPLAQTWTVSPSSSLVCHNKVIEKTCSSFDTRCIRKVCMSTAALPFHVRDLSMWDFREACREQHLDKHRGFVGKTLLDRGSCYVQDVTQLSEQEYPLVHSALMSGLTSCFTIFLHSVEGNDYDDDYVLEFFLRLDNKDSSHVLSLVRTLKQNVEAVSGFELGEISSVEVTETPRDVGYPSLSIIPRTIQISSTTTVNTLMDSSDSASSKQNHPNVQKMSSILTDAGKKNQGPKQRRKRKIDSLTMEAVEQHVGKPLGQTAQLLSVSRSTLKRFCRQHGISSWPVPKHGKRSDFLTNPKQSLELWSGKHLQQLSLYQLALLIVALRRWRRNRSNRRSYDASSFVQTRGAGHVPDTGLLTVKASFKDDMIKFPFPVSRGFSELETEVAERVNVKSQRLSLKYEDEENDLVLITCDADLKFLAGNTTVKLIVHLADD